MSGGMTVQKPKPFATEAALCAAFIAALPPIWVPYAETAGWDILLVRKADGFQIGIQAKLRLNSAVIAQALEDGRWDADCGPDCRAVLVPHDDAGPFDKIAAYVGFTIIRMSAGMPKYRIGESFRPELPDEKHQFWTGNHWFELLPTRRHALPEYVPDVAAGASAPVQLTNWKLAALKIAATVELRGYVTRADFKHHEIDYRRWLLPAYGWLHQEDGRFVAGPRLSEFKAQHPRVYAEIIADAEKWMPPAPKPPVKQEALL